MRPLLAAALAVALAGCTESPTTPGPDGPDFELVDPGQRMASYNAHVYGSFSVAAGGGVITSGPANFPGHPRSGPGTCVDGKWYNPQGNPTSGSLDRPHPHCFSAGATIEVVLEPITACYTGVQDKVEEAAGTSEVAEEPVTEAEKEPAPIGKGCPVKQAVKGATVTSLILREQKLADDQTTLWDQAEVTATDFHDLTLADQTSGKGIVLAYAIDAATLGTTNKRVGTLRIDLIEYASDKEALIHLNDGPGCAVDEAIESPCLNRVIKAVYNPLPPEQGGIGPTDKAVEGFLWVTPANSPYNYTE